MSAHTFASKYLDSKCSRRCASATCKTVRCSNGWVVVWRREECGRSGNKKRDRETMMPL